MKISIVTHSLDLNYSGGSIHVNNVVKRLVKYFDIEFIPTISFFTNNQSPLEIIDKIKEYGIEVPDFIDSLVERYKNFKPSFLPYPARVYEEYAKNIKTDADLIFEPDYYNSLECVFLSKNLNIPLGVTLHEPSLTLSQSITYTYYSLRPFFLRSLDYFIKRSFGIYWITKIRDKYLSHVKNNLKFIAAVSKGTLDSVKINARKYLIYPGNGVDKELLNYRTKNKEDYIVFWTTLIPPKGILNFIYMLKLLKDKGIKIKAKVAGKFLYEKFKKLFFKYVTNNSLDVEYLGFLDKEKLYEMVSKAKLLVYPSLHDGFSITVLEALALGIPVIAYSIPTVYSVYKDVPAVKFVKEGDIKKMAEEVEKELNEGKLLDAVFSDKVKSFVEFHNWDNVTESIVKIIKDSIQ